MWCWYRQVTLTADTVYFLIAWPGGVREGRAASATLSDSPRIKFLSVSKPINISQYEQSFRIYPEIKEILEIKEKKKRILRYPS